MDLCKSKHFKKVIDRYFAHLYKMFVICLPKLEPITNLAFSENVDNIQQLSP